MINTIYIEEEIIDHPRVKKICNYLKRANKIIINRYTEVFNKKSQNFRIQKIKPALILSKKYDNFIHKAPDGYGIGGVDNYYFAHMLNCPFDCRYCFLQGMFYSANYVLFVNYEDFFDEIIKLNKINKEKKITLFSGYDSDSLAVEGLTGFVKDAIPFFKKYENILMELRTKSTYIKPLLNDYAKNIVVAYSFTPESFSEVYEKGVPSIKKRLNSISQLVKNGWNIGLRFDPIVCFKNWKVVYKNFFNTIFDTIPEESIHSVTYGTIRFPVKVLKNIEKLYPDEKLFYFVNEENFKLYNGFNREEMVSDFCRDILKNYVDENKIFHCYSKRA